jgi:hypothetical protein
MTQPAFERNPFMLMINPEVVLAAIEKSERLGKLNRHLCRPLDRVSPSAPDQAAEVAPGGDGDSVADCEAGEENPEA